MVKWINRSCHEASRRLWRTGSPGNKRKHTAVTVLAVASWHVTRWVIEDVRLPLLMVGLASKQILLKSASSVLFCPQFVFAYSVCVFLEVGSVLFPHVFTQALISLGQRCTLGPTGNTFIPVYAYLYCVLKIRYWLVISAILINNFIIDTLLVHTVHCFSEPWSLINGMFFKSNLFLVFSSAATDAQ